MADLNKVMLIGRLSRDPQLRYLPSQSAVCDFGFAVGRKFKTANGEQKEETCFLDCTVFGKGAEVFNQYMRKGSQAYVEGRLRLDVWDDKTTGQKRSKVTVVVEDFQFLDSKARQDGGNEGGEREQRPSGRPGGYDASRQAAPAAAASTDGDRDQFKDDDIPF